MRRPARWYPALAAVLAIAFAVFPASPLAAQTPLRGAEPDTLGLAPDTVRLTVGRVEGMGRCEIIGHAVVKDRADLRRLRRYPQCAKVSPPLEGRTLVGLSVWGDCQAMYRVDAFRSAKRRELRVRLRIRYGGCRGMLPHYEWLSLPALPAGWAVRFTESRVDGDAPLDFRDWTATDPSRH
jgi:hypothetical protein